jgi:uncharacterized membrane protein YoaT (DUF817 family)
LSSPVCLIVVSAEGSLLPMNRKALSTLSVVLVSFFMHGLKIFGTFHCSWDYVERFCVFGILVFQGVSTWSSSGWSDGISKDQYLS